MRRFDILDPSLDVFQSCFLEASAGTGKTFAIEHLLVRLILESKEPIQLQEILAVTFTREAAAEMKERIREKLESLEDLDEEASARIKEALIYFDEAQIFTIHGFCHRMLSEFAFEAKTTLQMEEVDHQKQLRQTIEDFFHTGSKEFSHEISFLLKRVRYDLDKLIHLIAQEVDKEHSVERVDWQQLLELLKPQNFSTQSLKEDFFKLAPRYKRFKPENFEAQVETLATCLQERDYPPLLEEKSWFFERMNEDNAKVKAEPLSSYSLNYPGLFETLNRQLLPKIEKERDPKVMIKRLAHECTRRWSEKTSRTDLYSPDSLLGKMRGLLSQESFVSKIKEKYKAVIIDEFQDTDPIQWSIFSKLFLDKLLFLVGDPKQSIYGFRNADIYTYMNAANALGEEKKAYLDTNYRSSPNLINALNRLFSKYPDWIELPSLPNALSYHSVKAGRDENKLEEPPIQFFLAEGSMGRERGWPTKDLEEKKLFPYIAHEILRLRMEKQVPFSQFVILVKDRFHAQRLYHHLARWNIPASIKRTLNLAESRGYLAMEDLIRAVQSPSNESYVHAALCGPLFGYNQEMLKKDLSGKALLGKLSTIFHEEGFASFYEAVYEETTFQSDTSLFYEFRQTAEILMGKENPLRQLQELKQLTPEEDERLKLQNSDGGEKVAIMTTFGSKGLEFEVVFALSMASRHFESESDVEKDAEKMRQLYVAFTRSREKLYIPLLFDLDHRAKTSPLEQFFSKWSDDLVGELEEMEMICQWVKDIPITPYISEKKEIPIHQPPTDLPYFEITPINSFSSLAKPHIHETALTDLYLAQDLNEKTLHTMPLGAQTGVIIHTIFEKIFAQRNLSYGTIVKNVIEKTELEGWEKPLTSLANDIMTMPLLKNFALQDLKPGNYFEEMEFLYSDEKQLIKGFADLIFMHDGKYYLLDWKTNWLGHEDDSYSQEIMKKAMERHDYFLQARLYGQALERYVKLLDNRPFNECFAGSIYVFLRGKGVYYF